MAAEAYTSKSVRFVTLTYDEDNLASGWMLPKDHIKIYNASRRRMFSYKAFVVGEYGAKNERPHWHALQFYPDAVPREPLGFSSTYKYWTKGNSCYELPRSLAASASYLYDYLDKGGKALRPSPGIGRDYLMRYARLLARERRLLVKPDSGIEFTVPGANNKQGQPWVYRVPNWHSYANDMANEYLDAWGEYQSDTPSYAQLERVNYG